MSYGKPITVVLLGLALGCGRIGFEPIDGDQADTGTGDAWTGDASCSGVCADAAKPGARIVFATSEVYAGDLGGLLGADDKCQQAANNASLPGVFRAWLSDTTGNPAGRMVHHDGPYTLVDGTVIAADWDDLIDGQLLAPIDRNEYGGMASSAIVCVGGEIWSNTGTAGEMVGDQHCNDWSTGDNTAQSTTGNLTLADSGWTDSICTNVTCLSTLAIYCFQQ